MLVDVVVLCKRLQVHKLQDKDPYTYSLYRLTIMGNLHLHYIRLCDIRSKGLLLR